VVRCQVRRSTRKLRVEVVDTGRFGPGPEPTRVVVKVAVIGLGYVGTVTSAGLASNGHTVCAVDVNPSKVAMLGDGHSPVVEPGLDDMVRAVTASRALTATNDPGVALEDAELSLICVGTPSSSTGRTDLQFVTRAVEDVGRHLVEMGHGGDRFHSIILRSTVPPGTSEEVVQPAVDAVIGESPISVGVGMCPEFLREGSALSDFYSSPLTVIGTSDTRVAESVRRLFDFLGDPVKVVAPRVAESIKYACNAFHATKITFANEMGRLLREFGVDAREVMDIFCEDTKLNISPAYLSPGFAFGGSCLPKDLRSLLHEAQIKFLDLPLLSGVMQSNSLAVGAVIDRVVESDARSVALLGLSFKMLSDDLRESPYVMLAETLIGKGFDVRIYDPIVEPSKLVGANRDYVDSKLPHLGRLLGTDPSEVLMGADLALVSSSDPTVIAALRAQPPRTIIDLCGRLGTDLEALAGYEGVAWAGLPGGSGAQSW